MTADIIDLKPARPAAPQKPTLQWGAAFRALQRLFADKEDTTAVFDIMRALNGTSIRDGYNKLLLQPEGGRMAYDRVELADKLMDDAWLDAFAPGTVGAAYRDFVRSEQLSAEGLAEVSRQGDGAVDIKHPYAWFGRRNRDVHDIWHILSGYHRDALGEASLVAFPMPRPRVLAGPSSAWGPPSGRARANIPMPRRSGRATSAARLRPGCWAKTMSACCTNPWKPPAPASTSHRPPATMPYPQKPAILSGPWTSPWRLRTARVLADKTRVIFPLKSLVASTSMGRATEICVDKLAMYL